MAISTPDDICSREEACKYIQTWLLMEGLSVQWIDIVKEFSSLKELYQENPRKRFRVPMFEVVCVFKRLAYRYGK